MKSLQRSSQAQHSGRRIAGRAQQDHILDPYQAQHKPEEPTACPKCGAVYHQGRWQWGPRPDDAHAEPCPACRRIADALPAGVVTLHGAIVRQRKDELTGLARHVEAAEKSEHPLNRIIAIAETPEGLVISTTDIHLPRRLGEAVKRAFHGELVMHFDDAAYFARVDWRGPG
jgi:NMD protein affecting ribosome stability and mRNA decay